MTESRLPGSQVQTTNHELQWKEKSVPEKSVGDSRGRSSGLNHHPRRESLSVKPQDSQGGTRALTTGRASRASRRDTGGLRGCAVGRWGENVRRGALGTPQRWG